MFEWKEPEKQGNLNGKQIGLLAQEVEEIFPEWVGTDSEGFKDLTIRGFEALAVESFKEIKRNLDELKSAFRTFQGQSKEGKRGRIASKRAGEKPIFKEGDV
jgi:hypothetical protein